MSLGPSEGSVDMKQFYCHECGKSFLGSQDTVACIGCSSEFIEELETEESRTTGTSASGAFSNPPPSTTPSSAATSTATGGARPSSSSTRTQPINITIGPNPIFRSGMGFPGFVPGGSGGRDSPMEMSGDDEDPGDEVVTVPQLRRRQTSQVRSGNGRTGITGVFPGGMFVVSQSPRLGGIEHHSLGQMLHEHIAGVMAQRDAQDSAQNETDGRQEATQQQPRQGQQGGGGATPGSTDTPPTGGTEGGGGARGTTASTQNARRNNVHVINFPSVQVMMTRGGHPVPVGGQQQQPGTSQGGATGGGGGGGASNPQLPQFGAPMFFGLPLGPLMGLHGSPGDYAWGPQGLENIISQMLANLEDTGAPPTEKEKMEALPLVQVTEKELEECALCSVCKDEFTVGESLVKLPCEHLYHKDCIFPWLEMHDTCPTCRFHLNTGKYEDDRTP